MQKIRKQNNNSEVLLMINKNRFAISSIAFAAALILLLSSAPYVSAAESDLTPHSWYVMRTKDHTQPRLEGAMSFIEAHGGYYVDKAHADISSDDKVVYLTFDAGYENGNVARILDTMKEKDVAGAFFILENLMVRDPELVLRMHNEGHLVCNHTCSHRDMSAVCDIESFRGELDALSARFYELTGSEMPKYYRPPEGKFCERNLKFCEELGYKTVFWSFAYADWDNNKQPSREEAMKTVLGNVHNGAVLLLHPTSKTNADILGELIDTLKSEGYRFGTLDELTGCAVSQ